jgi:hypothetical protein
MITNGIEIQYITFHNNTDLPVIVEGWHSKMPGLSTLVPIRVDPRQQVIVHSTTGEWYMNSMFYNKKDKKRWKGLEKHHIVGKFRSRPCASGDYSWLEYDEPFRCIYSETEDLGKITFSMT